MPVKAFSGYTDRRASRPIDQTVRNNPYTQAAPVRGWNTRDPLSSMDEAYAPVLDNWFPHESSVVLRRGSAVHVSGLGGPVETLMEWAGPGVVTKAFAAADRKIYDVSSAGVAGAPSVSSLQNDRWQTTMFGNSSGNYLVCVNGVDNPRLFNGSVWSTPTYTGISDPTSLINVSDHKKRLIFVPKNSLSFYYMDDVSTVSGPMSEFSLASLASLGGHLVLTTTWSLDGGAGLDDYFVAITSKGQVIIYSGTDPGSASNWSLVGVFRISPPLGRRAALKWGSDVIIMTEAGFSKLSSFLAAAEASNAAAMSDVISDSVHQAVKSSAELFGWQPVFYPNSATGSPMLLFNVPTATGSVQFVSNATTGSWCRFTGLDGWCMAVIGRKLYYGDNDGNVIQADVGFSDQGSDIVAVAQQAYTYMKSRGYDKSVRLVKPNLVLDGPVSVSLHADSDFRHSDVPGSATFSDPSGTAWGEGEWDDDAWADEPFETRDWQSVEAFGEAISLHMTVTSGAGSPKWNSTSWMYERTRSGGYL